ncbi:unnamed protein product, partial [Mesorhabditis spiculigera]
MSLRFSVLLLLTCLVGLYLNGVAADCYSCYEADPDLIKKLEKDRGSGWVNEILDMPKRANYSSNCEKIWWWPVDVCAATTCMQMLYTVTAYGKPFDVAFRGCGEIKKGIDWGFVRGVNFTMYMHACEGPLCNKLSPQELKDATWEGTETNDSNNISNTVI